MATVFDVAKWFLQKESMTHKKLQKLCYYAQAWSFVLSDRERLFDGTFEAWAHGPVNRVLWNSFREFGYMEITPLDCDGDSSALSTDEANLLTNVWDTYGEFTGFQLENLTHRERPWIEARGSLPDCAPSHTPISEETMREYYLSQYAGDGIGE